MEGSMSFVLPPIAFLIFSVVAYILFGIGKQMAVPFEDVEGKTEPYLCGEDLDLGTLAPGYWQFFAIAILFTILHITIFMIALMPSEAVFYTILYMVAVAAAVGVLVGEIKLTVPPRDQAIQKLRTKAKIIDASTGMPVGDSGSSQALD